MPRGLLAALAVAVAVAAPACRRDAERAPALEDEPLAAELSGCAAVVRPGADASARVACALAADRRVRLHVPRSGGRVEVVAHASSPVPVQATRLRDVPGGALFVLQVPDEVSSIEARWVADGSSQRHASCTFTFVPSPRPPWYAEAQALRDKGKLDEAVALARARADGDGPLAERAMAEGILARVALRRGEVDESARRFRAAIELDDRAGLVSDRIDDALALVFLLHKRARRYSEARAVLDEIGPGLDAYPDGRAREPLYRAQVAWETGDTRSATRMLDLAIERASLLGADGIARAARQVRAMVACSAGTRRACVASLREAERELSDASDVHACERAEVSISLGFAQLEEAEVTGEIAPSRLGEADQRGLDALDEGCPDPYMRAVALEHLAMAAVLGRDPKTARRRLSEAKALAPAPRIGDAVMWLDIEGRIAEVEGARAAALAAFDAAHALARGAALRTQQWRALVGRGRVLESTKRRDEALAAWREAEAVLDEMVALVPFGEGRASAAADGRESMRRATRLLVEQGKAAEALDVVRHARARLVRSLAVASRVAALSGPERERWERAVAEYREARALVDADAEGDWRRSRSALDAAIAARAAKLAALRARLDDAMVLLRARLGEPLPALPPSETTLALVRLGAERDGVLVFVVERGRTRALPVGAVLRDESNDALGDQLLGPARAELEHASRVRVLADDALGWIDVHALPLDGAPLVARAPVVYGADLAAARDVPERPRRTLVVADPTGDLPSARVEGAAVARLLDARSLVGRDATSARVRDELARATTFHYAGHGVFEGREGSGSTLPLAQGGALTIDDVLTLARAPREVVLSGCETGRTYGGAGEGATGIAQAFLVAGAEIVVAPTRVVDDRAAGAFAVTLHERGEAGAADDLASSLRRAQLRTARERRGGWQAFRAFVR